MDKGWEVGGMLERLWDLHFVACGVLFDPTSQTEGCVNSLGRDRTGFCSLISFCGLMNAVCCLRLQN